MFKIEKSIPMPMNFSKELRESLNVMSVGESILVPKTKSTKPTVYYVAKSLGASVSTQTEKNGIRVWLTKKPTTKTRKAGK